jgi:hypothetical protein
VSRSLASLFAALAVFGAGALAGAAVSSGGDPAPAPAAQSTSRAPVEVRTIVKRRTVHVYRKPKRRPVAPAPPAAPPAPVRAVAPAAPAAPAPAPLETRTSGTGGRAHGDDEGEHESEGGDD